MFPLNNEDIRFLRRHFSPQIIDLSKNETVQIRRYEDSSVVLLLDGLVYLCAENEQYSRSILRFFRQGEIFFDTMLLPTEYGVSYLQAKTASRMAVLNREKLVRFCFSSPEWQKKLSGLLDGNRLSYCFLLHHRSIRARLKLFFQEEMIIQHGYNILMPIPYTDLADYLAVDRTAMMKELKKMKEEGLISGKQRSLTIHEIS